ncbi:hypothetical protein, partial [Modestobacter roseus]|uniref:hypothetical protein n=1 Tax=Modestobacter roseus TaxID=1181884 RepID=UPI00188603A8
VFDGEDLVRLLIIYSLIVVGLVVFRRARIKRLGRRQVTGTTPVAVRTVQGVHRQVPDRWQRRLAEPRPGRLDLSRWLVDGRSHVVLDVLVVRRGERPTTWWERSRTDDLLDVVLTVQTTTGELEVAVGRAQAEWLRTQLTPIPVLDED